MANPAFPIVSDLSSPSLDIERITTQCPISRHWTWRDASTGGRCRPRLAVLLDDEHVDRSATMAYRVAGAISRGGAACTVRVTGPTLMHHHPRFAEPAVTRADGQMRHEPY